MKQLLFIALFFTTTACLFAQNTFPTTGKVGIGTTNPQEELEVNGNIKAQGAIIKSEDPNNWKPFLVGREVKPGMRNFEFVVNPDSNPEDYLAFAIQDKTGDLRQNMVVQDNHTNINARDDNGNEIFKIAHDTRNNKTLTFFHMPKSSSRVVIGSWGEYLIDQGHKLVVKDGTAMIEKAIYTNGEIGIGTTNTQGYKLAVNGRIHTKEVKVDLIGWADYVFEDSYSLPTLEEVENHISQKGHLINVPSAKDVAENGIQLGEMNAKLLEKIEELTLYTIAQEKKLKEQKAINKQQATNNQQLEARLTKIEALLSKK